MKRLVRILPIALIFLSANTWAAGPDAGSSKATADPSNATAGTSGGRAAATGTGAPSQSGDRAARQVQESVVKDLKHGKEACEGLAGKPRAACEARAAATAEAPRGRGSADPTGTGQGAPSKAGDVK